MKAKAKYKVMYIDDEITRKDAKEIQERLESSGEFECNLQPPPKLISGFPLELPDALLVDLDLSAPVNGEIIGYYGSTLASEVRMRHPACPIVLITKPQFFSRDESGIEKKQLLQESHDVDLILYKRDIIKAPDTEREKIISIIDGFKSLESISGREWERVFELMKADEDESHLLREAAPPVKKKAGKEYWNIPQTARWIRNVVLEYPGILYDKLTAATRLGISLESFEESSVQKLMKEAKYTGIFSSNDTGWWRGRLFRIAQKLMDKHKIQGPVYLKFAESFYREKGEKLSPAICVDDGTPVADWVCYILKKPVKLENSIPYYPDNRPAVMDQARVSRKAIKRENEFDETLVDADSYEAVKTLWELP